MPREPVGSRAGGALELVRIGGEMTAGEELESLRLAGAVVSVQREIRRGDGVVIADDHQQRRRCDALDEQPGLVLGVQLERSQGDLVLPLAKSPLILATRLLPR